jgi:hypothetical protein
VVSLDSLDSVVGTFDSSDSVMVSLDTLQDSKFVLWWVVHTRMVDYYCSVVFSFWLDLPLTTVLCLCKKVNS